MKEDNEGKVQYISLVTDSGAYRMVTSIINQRYDNRKVNLMSVDSLCLRIQSIPDFLHTISFKKLFFPFRDNPFFISTEKP